MALKAVICMPSYRGTSRPAIKLAARLEARHGWPWPDTKGDGHSHVGKARNILASNLLTDPALSDVEWSFWMDDDMAIHHLDVIEAFAYVRANGIQVGMLMAVPGRFGTNAFACELAEFDARTRPDGKTAKVVCLGPKNGRHYRAHQIGFGVVFMHRSVLEQLRDSGAAPRCALAWSSDGTMIEGWEFFPSGVAAGLEVMSDKGERIRASAGEDYGFSVLCKRQGIPMHVLTQWRTWHIHDFPYTWEDAFTRPHRAGPGNDWNLEVEL